MLDEWMSISRDKLWKLYAKLPATAIAAQYEVTPGAVYHRLRAFGIKAGDVGKHAAGPKKSFNPPKVELERLYKTMSMAKIAAHYGVGETVIFMRLKQHGIGGISRSDRLKEYKRTPEHQANITAALPHRPGPKNPNWKGGVSSENLRARSRKEYRIWKLAVLEKHNFKCSKCGIEQGYVCECCGGRVLLHAHHIKSFSNNPKKRYDVKNGIALCNRCHFKEHH